MEFATNSENSYFRCAARAIFDSHTKNVKSRQSIASLLEYKGVTVADLEWLVELCAREITTMRCVADHPLVDMNFIDRFPDAKWPFDDMAFHVMRNPNTTMDTIRSRPGPHPDWVWDGAGISRMQVITMDFVLWALPIYGNDIGGDDWELLSQHPCITFADIQAHPEFPWCSFYASRNPNVTEEIVLANLDYDWYWKTLAERKDFSIAFILEHSSIDLDDQPTDFLTRLLHSNHFEPKTMLKSYLYCYNGQRIPINQVNAAMDRYDEKLQTKYETKRVAFAKINLGKETNHGIASNIIEFLD
jgi:hypothetical protein